MSELKELLQNADWKKEKHVPVIECAQKIKKGQLLTLSISVGKEIAHPNTTAHHIRWIEVYFLPNDEKFPYQLGRAEFSAHGASVQGADTSTVYTEPCIRITFKTEKPGTVMASSYCNIHGLWQSAQGLAVE
jgi:superoxide reductase